MHRRRGSKIWCPALTRGSNIPLAPKVSAHFALRPSIPIAPPTTRACWFTVFVTAGTSSRVSTHVFDTVSGRLPHYYLD